MVHFTGLPRVLEDAGVSYTLVPGWKTRTAHAGGLTENRATFWHTTESTDKTFKSGGNCPTLGYVVDGLGYPLYNILIGRNGHVYLIAAGTSAHAGTGSISGIPTDDGNRYALSVSFDANNKGYPVTAAQLEAGARVGAAIDRDWGRPRTGRHIMHGEWAPSRRSDPTRIPGGWTALRAAIKRGHWAAPELNKPAPPRPTPIKPNAPTPTPTKPKEWSDMASKSEIESVVRTVVREEIAADRAQKGVRWPQSDGSGYSDFTQDQALGYIGEHWKREGERDAAAQGAQA